MSVSVYELEQKLCDFKKKLIYVFENLPLREEGNYSSEEKLKIQEVAEREDFTRQDFSYNDSLTLNQSIYNFDEDKSPIDEEELANSLSREFMDFSNPEYHHAIIEHTENKTKLHMDSLPCKQDEVTVKLDALVDFILDEEERYIEEIRSKAKSGFIELDKL